MRRGKLSEYYKKMGVHVGAQCDFFFCVDFGLEPYLVTLGDRVRLGENIRFITHDGGIHLLRNLYPEEFGNADLFGPITVGNNVFLGTNVLVMPGVTIGDNVVIGAGSIVTRDIPSNSVAAGVPCRVLRSVESYRDKLLQQAVKTKGMSPKEKRAYLEEQYR